MDGIPSGMKHTETAEQITESDTVLSNRELLSVYVDSRCLCSTKTFVLKLLMRN